VALTFVQKKANRPILHAFFGELMVGGFLSLLSFILVYSNALTQLSGQLFDGEDDFLPSMLEQIHVLLFLVFGVFMLEILFLLAFAHFQNKKWRRTEKAIVRRVGQPKSVVDARDKAEFEALRLQFVEPVLPHPGDPSLPSDFIFSHYLAEVLGKAIAEMVSIPISVWLSVLFTFVIFFLVAGAEPVAAIALFVGMIYLLAGGNGEARSLFAFKLSVL
jgi:hypothetical protein